MNKAYAEEIVRHLEAHHKTIPNYIKVQSDHWSASLYIAQLLIELGENHEAYEVLKCIYEEKEFHFDKDYYGTYEDYIVDKVKFLTELATLSLEINPYESIGYLDEALNLLDGVESVYPYIDIQEIKGLKRSYVSRLA